MSAQMSVKAITKLENHYDGFSINLPLMEKKLYLNIVFSSISLLIIEVFKIYY